MRHRGQPARKAEARLFPPYTQQARKKQRRLSIGHFTIYNKTSYQTPKWGGASAGNRASGFKRGNRRRRTAQGGRKDSQHMENSTLYDIKAKPGQKAWGARRTSNCAEGVETKPHIALEYFIDCPSADQAPDPSAKYAHRGALLPRQILRTDP